MDTNEQKKMLESVQSVMDKSEPDEEELQHIRTILDDLWAGNSEYILQSAELLANGSRNRK